MRYRVDEKLIPEELRTRGTKVWVSDSVVETGVLHDQGLRAVMVLLLKDLYGQVELLFAMPADAGVTREDVAQCRQCALQWILEWERAGVGQPRLKNPASR